MTRTILIPHDGKIVSDIALKYALGIAESMNMKIKLVRIIPEILDISTMSHWTQTQRRRVRKEIKLMRKRAYEAEYEKLQKQVSLINSRGVEGSALVAEAVDVPDKIVEQIKKDRPYLVVIGSKKLKRRGRFSRIQLLGSVGRKLTEQSPRPILIVK